MRPILPLALSVLLGGMMPTMAWATPEERTYTVPLEKRPGIQRLTAVDMETAARFLRKKIEANGGIAGVRTVQGKHPSLTVKTTHPSVLAFVLFSEQEGFTVDIRVKRPQEDYRPIGMKTTYVRGAKKPTREENDTWSVQLDLSTMGRKTLARALASQPGNSIGLFIRKQLISSLTLKKSLSQETLIVGGIPTQEIAQLFADSINTRLRLTFGAPIER